MAGDLSKDRAEGLGSSVSSSTAEAFRWSGFSFRAVAHILLGLTAGGIGALLERAAELELGAGPTVTLLLGIPTIALTVFGWLKNAELNRANSLFLARFNLQNEARLNLVAAVRDEQRWINRLCQLGESIRLREQSLLAKGVSQDQVARFRQHWARIAVETLSPDYLGRRPLLQMMAEYENVFPETRRLRSQFRIKQDKLVDYFRTGIDKMQTPETWDEGVKDIETTTIERDYAHVLWDLIVHLQNSTLSLVFDHRVPPRELPSNDWPHIEIRPDGQLTVAEAGHEWADLPLTKAEAAWLKDPINNPKPPGLKVIP